MKCNPLVSMPIAIGLLAIAASQVFSTFGKLAVDHEREVAEQSVVVVEAQNMPGPPRPLNYAVGRAMAVQQLRIVDPDGNPVILLSGTPAGGVIEMRSADGDRVMLMQAHPTGAYRHEVWSGDEVVARFGTAPDRGTHLRLSSPGRHSTLAADLNTRASTLTAFSTTSMDGRVGLYQWLSLSGATVDGRELLPGQLISSAFGLESQKSVPFAEHMLYSLEGLDAAIAETLPSDE